MGRVSTPTQHRTKVGADLYAVPLSFDMRGSRHTVQGQNTSAAPPETARILLVNPSLQSRASLLQTFSDKILLKLF
jgi:hypothetical protein